ncbi:hypothetical protein [Halomarina rubra]|uniref:Uncharacterized protein n=1 Tax=Halomarina rubra TaxID=2071873 RepID=A0ABD6B1I8_9EURY|nr:hypothetical protein [Halomarina rubra]
MCRAYGCLPHELPEQGTTERVFLETEFRETLRDDDRSILPLS